MTAPDPMEDGRPDEGRLNWRFGWLLLQWQNRSASGSQWFPAASSGSVLDETSDLEKEC